MFILLFFIVFMPSGWALIGIDVSQRVSTDQFQCLKENGYRFVVVRIYRSVGIVDWNAAETIRNARQTALNSVEVYFLPCLHCDEDPGQQLFEALEFLNDELLSVDRLWLVVEGQWTNQIDFNRNFLDELFVTARTYSIPLGISTNRSNWSNIINDDERYATNVSLWYSNEDKTNSFDDYQTFGGWTRPTLKQYQIDVKDCGVVFDKNFS